MASAIQISTELVIDEKALDSQFRNVSKRFGQIPIGLKDDFSAPLGRVVGQTKNFDKAIGAATDRVVAFGAAASAFYAVQRSITALVKSTIDVENSLARININLNESQKGLEDFSRQIFDIARNTGNTFDEAAKGAEELTRQGLGATETLKRLNDALILSRQTGLSAADSIEAITAAVNSFQREALSSTSIINKLAAVDQKFAVSSKDLAEGIARAGSTAADAGVSFDELLGLITAVQQQTQRGGAVIGNSFKTFFAKLSDKQVLDNLEAIGIGVRNIAGQALPATQILENLGRAYGNLSDSQKKLVNDNVGTLFQINSLRAVLSDVGDEFGVVARATQIANRATDQAIIKNAALNTTLKASFNSLQQSVTQILSGLGKINLGPILEGTVKAVDGLAQSLTSSDAGDSAGKSIGESILQGISNVITGPGLILLLQLFTKTALAIGRTVTTEFSSILKINDSQQNRVAIEDQINRALQVGTDLELAQFAAAASTAEQHKVILSIVERTNAELLKASISRSALAETFLVPGLLGSTSTFPRRAASGLLPAISGERAAISKGVGGASASARPVLIPNFAFGGGKHGPVVANTSEWMVPNYANGGSAIFNPDMVKSMGLPKGAKHLAGGFIPSFASIGDKPLRLYRGEYNGPKGNLPDYVRESPEFQFRQANVAGRFFTQDQSIAQHYADEAGKFGAISYLDVPMRDALKYRVKNLNNQAGKSDFAVNPYAYSLDPKNEFFLPQEMAQQRSFLAGGWVPNFADFFRGVGGLGGDKAVKDLILKGRAGSPGYGQTYITPDINVAADYAANNATSVFNSKGTDRGFIFGINTDRAQNPQGTMQHSFEEKVLPSLTADEVKTIQRIRTTSGEGSWDYSTSVGKPRDFSRFSKLYKGLFAAGGFIPSFANPLLGAIAREKAAGVSASSIYVDHDSRLAGSGNPLGLLVANRRDEPTGGAQGISRVLKQGGNPKFAGLAHGFVPNFAASKDVLRILGLIGPGASDSGAVAKGIDISGISADVNPKRIREQLKKLLLDSIDLSAADLVGPVKTQFNKLLKEVISIKAGDISKLAQEQQKSAFDTVPVRKLNIVTGESQKASPEALAAFLAERDAAGGGPRGVATQLPVTEAPRRRNAVPAVSPLVLASAVQNRKDFDSVEANERAAEAARQAKAVSDREEFYASGRKNREDFDSLDRAEKEAAANAQAKARFKNLSSASTTLGGLGLFGGATGTNRDLSKLTKANIDVNDTTIKKLLEQRNDQRSQRDTNRAFGLSFGAPLLAGFVEPSFQAAGLSTKGGTAGGQGSGAISGALQGIGIGALFGPGTAALGAIVGGLVGVFGKLTKSSEELNEELDKSNAVYVKNIDSIERVIAITNQEKDLGPNATPAARRALAADKVRSAAGITNAGDRAALLAGGLSERDQQDILIRNSERESRGISANNAIKVGDQISRGSFGNNFIGTFLNSITSGAANPFTKQGQSTDLAAQLANIIDKSNIGKVDNKPTAAFLKNLSGGRATDLDVQGLKKAYASIGDVGNAANITVDNLDVFADALKKAIALSKVQQAAIEEQVKRSRELARKQGNLGDFRSAPLSGGTPFGDVTAQQRLFSLGAGAGNSLTPDLQRSAFLDFFDEFAKVAPKALDQFKAIGNNKAFLENEQSLDELSKTYNAAADALSKANPEGRYRDDSGRAIRSAVDTGLSQQIAGANQRGDYRTSKEFSAIQLAVNTKSDAVDSKPKLTSLNGYQVGTKYSTISSTPADNLSQFLLNPYGAPAALQTSDAKADAQAYFAAHAFKGQGGAVSVTGTRSSGAADLRREDDSTPTANDLAALENVGATPPQPNVAKTDAALVADATAAAATVATALANNTLKISLDVTGLTDVSGEIERLKTLMAIIGRAVARNAGNALPPGDDLPLSNKTYGR